MGFYLPSLRRYKYEVHWYTPLIMLAYIMFFRVVAVFALRYVSFLRR
jgi:hypothetical protein